MTASPLPEGKVPVELLVRLLAELPPPPAEVRLGPRVGEDAAAIDVAAGTLVVATDPITLTTGDLGRFAVVVNANDVAVTGARPRWFLSVVLLPPGTVEPDVEALLDGMREALAEAGIALVGGHTEISAAVTQPVVVGQMLGLAEGGRFVATGGLRPGDVVVQVGPAPIEGGAVLAREAGGRLDELDERVVAVAARAVRDPGISVVDPALLAAELGATSLHDPTEGGLAAGLCEMADASGLRIRIDRDAVRWFGPAVAVCRVLVADPWATLASGTLLAGFPPDMADAARGTLADRGHEVAAIGLAERGSGVVDAAERPLPWPERDEVARVLAEA